MHMYMYMYMHIYIYGYAYAYVYVYVYAYPYTHHSCDLRRSSLNPKPLFFFPLFRRFFFQIFTSIITKAIHIFPPVSIIFPHFPHVSHLFYGCWRFLSLEIPCPVLFNGVLHYSAKHALLAAQFPDATDLLQVSFFGFEGSVVKSFLVSST